MAQTASSGTADSGLLWFYGPDNWEILVKVLNGCQQNNRFWVFGAAATTLQYTLTVTDTQTGAVRSYFNPLGQSSPAITDTNAFATCNGGPAPTPTPTPSGSASVRYLNDALCGGEGASGFDSLLQANGFSWESAGLPSPYQQINRTIIGPFSESNQTVCLNHFYNATANLLPGHRYTLEQSGGGLFGGPIQLSIVDEGPIPAGTNADQDE
jgi:hypothetical protein